jgi:hypothetical protein
MVAAPLPQDLVQNTILTGTIDQRGLVQVGGTGFQFNANDEGIRCTAPLSLQIGFPITIATHAMWVGTPSANCNAFGVCFNSTESGAFLSYAIVIDGSVKLNIQANSAGSFYSGSFGGLTITPTPFTLYSLIATFISGTQVLYINGSANMNATQASSPTYGTGPILAGGEYISGQSRNPNMVFFDGMIWNRILTPNERWMLDYSSPWDLYTPLNRKLYVTVPAAGGTAKVQNILHY